MITSTANAKVKRLAQLQKKRKLRDEENVFLSEGLRMCKEVPKGILKEMYVSESFWKQEKGFVQELSKTTGVEAEVFSDTVFAYVSDTKTPQGILCVCKRMEYTMKDLLLPEKPFLMVLDQLQDPGNLGTILRTAEGAGVTGILMSADCVDIYNPKTIRSTMGSVFRMPFVRVEDLPHAIEELKAAGVATYAAHLEGKHSYEEENYREACAFLIGNEGNGLRDEVAKKADTYIRIPMAGQVESLNAAIAATVLMFEAARQRR